MLFLQSTTNALYCIGEDIIPRRLFLEATKISQYLASRKCGLLKKIEKTNETVKILEISYCFGYYIVTIKIYFTNSNY